MPTVEDLSSSVFLETITYAIKRVLRTMVNLEADFVEEGIAEPEIHPHEIDSGPQVIGTVGFIGEINGMIYLTFPQCLAQSIAARLLGMTIVDVLEMGEEVVNDAIGELTNMTVGAFKNSLSDNGFTCRLTIPSILLGSNFHIEPFDCSSRRTYRFKVDGRVLAADLLFKESD